MGAAFFVLKSYLLHMKTCLLILLLLGLNDLSAKEPPLKIGVAGLTHGHVDWVFTAHQKGEIEIVGIAERNRALAEVYAVRYHLPKNLFFESLNAMLDKVKPEAVTSFSDTYAHLAIVQACAPRGIHVMVEKPLAVSLAHAREMQKLAVKHSIHLLTNYETSWYATTEKAESLLQAGKIGEVRKIVVHDGHKGPKKIGVPATFLEWLTDPVLNGAGALMDFGCYGANLSTWLLKGQRPLSVTCLTQQFNKEDHPKVDDEATIVVAYPSAQVIIQASWNWPIGRKDMEIYGQTGAIYADNARQLRVRMAKGYDGFAEEKMELSPRAQPFDDPFRVLTQVVRNNIRLSAYDLYSLENNLLVMEILEAAKKSARSGKTIALKD
jgi:predicted dehydrogenase